MSAKKRPRMSDKPATIAKSGERGLRSSVNAESPILQQHIDRAQDKGIC